MAVVTELFIYSQIISSSDPESLVCDASDGHLTITQLKFLTSQFMTIVADIFQINNIIAPIQSAVPVSRNFRIGGVLISLGSLSLANRL